MCSAQPQCQTQSICHMRSYTLNCETRETQQKHSSDHSVLHPPVVNVVLRCFHCWTARTNYVTVDRLTSLPSTHCRCECNPLKWYWEIVRAKSSQYFSTVLLVLELTRCERPYGLCSTWTGHSICLLMLCMFVLDWLTLTYSFCSSECYMYSTGQKFGTIKIYLCFWKKSLLLTRLHLFV